MQRIITPVYGFINRVCQMLYHPLSIIILFFSMTDRDTPELSGQEERPGDTVVPQRQFRVLNQPDVLLFAVKP